MITFFQFLNQISNLLLIICTIISRVLFVLALKRLILSWERRGIGCCRCGWHQFLSDFSYFQLKRIFIGKYWGVLQLKFCCFLSYNYLFHIIITTLKLDFNFFIIKIPEGKSPLSLKNCITSCLLWSNILLSEDELFSLSTPEIDNKFDEIWHLVNKNDLML